ncbi:MAG: hypothetical protein KKF56_03835 [Nanoarchaeota archaeon]|nr:hypothetical protein [Nanoarchaeota archaeon]
MKKKESLFSLFVGVDKRFFLSLIIGLISFVFSLYVIYVFVMKVLSKTLIYISDLGGLSHIVLNEEVSKMLLYFITITTSNAFLLGGLLVFVVGKFFTSLIWKKVAKKEFSISYYIKFSVFSFIFMLIFSVFIYLGLYIFLSGIYLLLFLILIIILVLLNCYYVGLYFLVEKDNFAIAIKEGFRNGIKLNKYWKLFVVFVFFGIVYFLIGTLLYKHYIGSGFGGLGQADLRALLVLIVKGFIPFLIWMLGILVVIFSYTRVLYYEALSKMRFL